LDAGIQVESAVWAQVTCTFVADKDAANFFIYAGAVPGRYPNNVGLSFWLDDIMFMSLDYALSNVIRTSITDVDVR
jgi:hypothetical protein